MAIMIGSARHDENGKYVNGVAGDQLQQSSTNDTVGEVSMQTMYTSSKGWYILRPKSIEHANVIAIKMKDACNNKNIGYDQNNRLGIITYGINTKTKTECDCSSLVREVVKEATGKDPGNFTTANEVDKLDATGLFEKKIAYVNQSNTPVFNGDVLVTKTKGHTAIVVSGNPRSTTSSNTVSMSTQSMESNVKSVQTWLNKYYSAGLVVDGSFGSKSKAALVKAWQKEVGGLAIDGRFGPSCKEAAKNHNIKKNSRGILVTIWQAFLVCKGYNPNGIDGKFGQGCHNATVNFQNNNGLSADGVVGSNTWYKALH